MKILSSIQQDSGTPFFLLILVLYNGLHFISINLSECLWYKYKKIEVKARPLFFCASFSQEVYWIFWFFHQGFFVYYVFGIGVWPFVVFGVSSSL